MYGSRQYGHTMVSRRLYPGKLLLLAMALAVMGAAMVWSFSSFWSVTLGGLLMLLAGPLAYRAMRQVWYNLRTLFL